MTGWVEIYNATSERTKSPVDIVVEADNLIPVAKESLFEFGHAGIEPESP